MSATRFLDLAWHVVVIFLTFLNFTIAVDEAEVHAPAYCTATTQESDSNSVPAKDKLEVSDSKCQLLFFLSVPY